jgi:predicted regulator of amino acid metabolism with ACT domain
VNNRPDITLALDVRSYETVFLASAQEGVSYPESWVRIESRQGVGLIVPDSVVVIDRVDIQRRTLATIAERSPRLIALLPQGVEQEKAMRRMVAAMFPWTEVWTVSTSIGKALIMAAKGRAYDRGDVLDARPEVEA